MTGEKKKKNIVDNWPRFTAIADNFTFQFRTTWIIKNSLEKATSFTSARKRTFFVVIVAVVVVRNDVEINILYKVKRKVKQHGRVIGCKIKAQAKATKQQHTYTDKTVAGKCKRKVQKICFKHFSFFTRRTNEMKRHSQRKKEKVLYIFFLLSLCLVEKPWSIILLKYKSCNRETTHTHTYR